MESNLGIRGNRVVKGDTPIQLRGVSFGNWMLVEHFMIGLPWVEYKMRSMFAEILGEKAYHEFWDTYMDAFIKEEDFKYLAEMGCNFIRLPFSYRHFEDDRNPGVFKTESFKYFDRVIEFCKKYDMYVLLDLHAAAGVQARDWNAESAYGESLMWDDPYYTKRTADLWRFIASRYVNEPRVMGYEILNEPLSPYPDVFNKFNIECIKAIREVDKSHIIVVESNEWGKKIHTLHLDIFKDPLVMPSLHHYPVHFHPFDKIKEYPCEFEGKKYGKEELVATLKEAYDPSYIDRPFYCGEFNHGNMNVLNDLVQIFEDNNIHWTLWSYKAIQMGLVYPRETTPWKQFQALPESQTLRNNYKKCCDDFTKALVSSIPIVNEGDVKHFMGQATHHWHVVTLPIMLKLLKEKFGTDIKGLAESFLFENCDFDKTRIGILAKFCK